MLYPYQCRTLLIPVKVLTEIAGQVNYTCKGLVPTTLQILKLKKEDLNKVYRLEIASALEGKQLDGFDFNLISAE